MSKYYMLIEKPYEELIDKEIRFNLYKKDQEFYTITSGDQISTLDEDGHTILHNTGIPGVVEADSEEDAAALLGVTKVDN